MSWVKENCVSFFELLCIKVVKTGRVPLHLALIMDGNRRYAKKNNVQRGIGHQEGFSKLSETLKWCLHLGIPEVTVYAFSIENFKRSDHEVKELMDLAREKFQRILDEIEQMNEWGVCLNVVGRLTLLPEDLRAITCQAMWATRNNDKLRLNIAYGYTARDEISRASSSIVDGVKKKQILPEDVDEDLVSLSLDLGEPDLLIRTSGEVRLSDFMLWQISNTVLYFSNVLWPEFTIWNLLAAILHFQRHAPCASEDQAISERKEEYLAKLDQKKWLEIETYMSQGDSGHDPMITENFR